MQTANELGITTNNHWHNFLYGYELTDHEKQEFDYMDSEDLETSAFFRYRKSVYSLDQFMRISDNSTFPDNWSGYHSESFFSGVLIQVSDCGDMYKVGSYFS